MQREKKIFILGCGLWFLSAVSEASEVNQQLAERLEAVQTQYQQAYQILLRQINQQFGLDYEALHQLYQDEERVYRQQLSIVERLSDRQTKRKKKEKLEAVFKTPQYLRYAEARLVLENELERNHLLTAQCLQAYEGILDELISSDPLLSSFFRSSDYRNRFGLLLKKVVWQLSGGQAAWTRPLDTYTLFADRRQMPFLIRLSPSAFTSVAFLRSLLIHELNHVLVYKQPLEGFESLPSFEAPRPQHPASSAYSWLFNLQYGHSSSYQYHLLHEYYAFKAQLLYDEIAPRTPYHRLSENDKKHIKHLYEWAYSELSPSNQEFVKKYPDPPLASAIQKYGASKPLAT